MNFHIEKALVFLMCFLILVGGQVKSVENISESLKLEKTAFKDADTIALAQIVFRHGPREPVDEMDVRGAVITDAGKKMLFDLGVKFRQRYGKILSSSYNPDEIQILSSEVGRAVQSAQMVLLGLYRDFNLAANWSRSGSAANSNSNTERIQFEPIPIQTLPKESDNLLQQIGDCPKRDELFQQAFTQWISDIFTNQLDLVSLYKENSPGLFEGRSSNLEKFGAMFALEEKLTFLDSENKTTPEWTLPLKDPRSQQYPLHNGFQKLFLQPEIRKFQATPFLQLLTDNFLAENPFHLHLYAGHDVTLSTVIGHLNFSDFRGNYSSGNDLNDDGFEIITDFGAFFVVELYQNSILKFFYADSGISEMRELHLPGCGFPCHLDAFETYQRSIVSQDFEKECADGAQTFKQQQQQESRGAENSDSETRAANVTIISSFSLLLILILIAMMMIYKSNLKKFQKSMSRDNFKQNGYERFS